MQVKILFLLKLVSFESLAGNDFFERGTQAAKETIIASVEVLDVIHRCSRNFCRDCYKRYCC